MTTTYTLSDFFGVNFITFDNGATADANGNHWYLVSEDGWSGAPAIRGGMSPWTGRHGGTHLPGTYESRTIVLSGVCKAASIGQFWSARDDLGALHASLINGDGILRVANEGGTRFCRVRATSDLKITPPMGNNNFEFQIGVTAGQPRKYNNTEQERVGTGTFDVTNAGNIDTFPTVELNATGAVTITNNTMGAFVSFSSMPSGTIIGFEKAQVYNGLVNYYDRISDASQWWSLAPGVSSITVTGVSVDFRHRDAWIT